MSADPHGRFVWFDLMTTDPKAARRFYGDLIGWTLEEWEGGEQPYTMFSNGGTTLGGSMLLPQEALDAGVPPHWLGYVGVADVDATVAQATGMGGKVVVPGTDIPTVGRFAVLADPQGAVLAVFTPTGELPGHEGMAEIGEFSWHELLATEHRAALAFYSALFGWEPTEAMDMGEMGIYQMYGRPGHDLTMGGMMDKPAEMPEPGWLFYVRVPDAAAAVDRVRELGGQVIFGPMDVPGGDSVAQCIDPQGGVFAVHSTSS
jgi:predicted enzyme related to lactoylglutathione lyase